MEFNIKTKTMGRCRVYPDSPNGLQPSVTSICGALAKYGLIDWAANCAVDYIEDYCDNVPADKLDDFFAEARQAHNRIKDEAADFGTLAHLLCQLYVEGKDYQAEIDKIEDEDVRTKAVALFESFKAWSDKNKIEAVHTEIKLHGDGYSGRCDLIAYRTCPKTGKRRLCLMDIKTGKGSYYNEWGLQLCAYADAYDDTIHNPPIEEIGIIKLNKDTLRCNYSEQTNPKFTSQMDILTEAWRYLAKFYWLYNNLYGQFKEIENDTGNQQ